MNSSQRLHGFLLAMFALAMVLILEHSANQNPAYALKTGPRKNPLPLTALLPGDLFLKHPPPNAVEVRAARETVEQGAAIVLRGRIGGVPTPFARDRALFLLADRKLKLCTEGCRTPWDYCCEAKQTILSNLATIQISDGNGRPLKIDIQGVNGLTPAAEVIVSGTVIQRTRNVFVVDARNIYVKPRPRRSLPKN